MSPGYVDIDGKRIDDPRNYGRLNVTDVLVRSSNVAMVRVAARIDNGYLAEKLRRYGLFSSQGIELPGEAAGLLQDAPHWSSTYKDYLSFGYGAELSVLQLAAGYAVLANGGMRKGISILQGGTGRRGVRVMDKAVADRVVGMLSQAVQRGTGKHAAVPPYPVAGKTGTAKKLKNGDYQAGAYTAVFCGMVPVGRPQLVVAVMIDQPVRDGFHGGDVAAPVFAKVASRVLRYLDIAPDALRPARVAGR